MKKRTILAFLLTGQLLLSAGSAEDQAKKQITVWSWFISSTMAKSIKAFEEKNPGLEVKYTYYNYSPEYITALKAAAASNSLPDIIGLQPGSLTQQYRQQLAPLNSYAEKEWGGDWQSKIFPVNLKQMAMGNPPGDGNFYILPQESQILVIWYNKEIFKKLNLEVPKTYSDLVAASKKVSSAGLIPVYQGAADGWQNENVFLMLTNQLAPGLVDEAQNG